MRGETEGGEGVVFAAIEAGRYERFTGWVLWGWTDALVEDATFTLRGSYEFGNGYVMSLRGRTEALLFESGTFAGGSSGLCMWKDGVWKDGVFNGGAWRNGTWLGGTWEGGTWYNGSWGAGTWRRGDWLDGTWHGGTWEHGSWYGGNWLGGEWLDGVCTGYAMRSRRHPPADPGWIYPPFG